MNTPINQVAVATKEEMSSKFNQIEDKMKTRYKILFYSGFVIGLVIPFIVILAIEVLPSIMHGLLPSIEAIWSHILAILISFFSAFFLLLLLLYFISKRMPKVPPIQKLYYHCYKIANKLKEYLQDDDPSHLTETVKSLKDMNKILIGGEIQIEDVPILRHNSEYKELLRLKSLFQKKVLRRLSSKTKTKDIKSLEFAFRHLSRFFYNVENTSSLHISIAKLEILEDKPSRFLGLFGVINLIEKGIYSYNPLVRFFSFYFIMVIVVGCVCGIAFFFGATKSTLIGYVITLPFIVATGLVTVTGKGKQGI